MFFRVLPLSLSLSLSSSLFILFMLSACGGAQHSIQLPPLEPLKLSEYTGPRFRVAVGQFKSLKIAQPFLKEIGLEGVEMALTEQMTNLLTESGYVDVLERLNLDRLVTNLNIEADASLFDQSTTGKKGKFVGAEYILVGAIEQIEPNMSVKEVNISIPFMGGLKGNSKQASVQIGVRLVESETGKVLASGIGLGVVKTEGMGLSVNRIAGFDGKFSLGSTHQTPMGYTFQTALNQALERLAQQLKKLPWSCRVAQVKTPRVFIECGGAHHLKAGMTFSLFKRKGMIKDAKGTVIGYDDSPNGEVTLVSVQPKLSIGTYTGSTQTPTSGDVIVFTPPEPSSSSQKFTNPSSPSPLVQPPKTP